MVSSGMLRRVALVRTDFLRSVRRLLVAACVVPSSPIFVTLMKEAPQEPHGVTTQKTPFFIVSILHNQNTAACGSVIRGTLSPCEDK
jgi:hypothetical protein